MHDNQIIDRSFDVTKSSSYHLSIQAGPDGFSFAILDPYHHKYIALVHHSFKQTIFYDKLPEKYLEIIKQSKYLNQDYGSITCICLSHKSTLLPSTLFDKNKLKMYFEFNHVLNDLDELHTNYLKHLDAYLIFPIYHEIANVLVHEYPKIRLFSQASPLIEDLLTTNIDEQPMIAIGFERTFFNIAVRIENTLKLHNCFTYRNPEDVIYFILYVFDKIQLDTEQIPVRITGNIDEKSEHVKIMRKFIKHIEFGKPNTPFEYIHLLHTFPVHHFANLLNLYHCV